MTMTRRATEHRRGPLRSRTLWAAIVAAGVLGVGCDDDSPFGISLSPADQEPAGYTDPAALLAAHEKALEQQDYDLYEKLLHADFEYFPRSEDLIDFPWLQGQISWARTDELQMIRNMFDDNFQSSDPYAATVDWIDAVISITGQQTLQDGTRVVLTQAVMTVMYMYPSGSGARADVRFEFRLVTGTDGFLRIRSIRELPPYQRAVESQSWARVKSLYRDEVL